MSREVAALLLRSVTASPNAVTIAFSTSRNTPVTSRFPLVTFHLPGSTLGQIRCEALLHGTTYLQVKHPVLHVVLLRLLIFGCVCTIAM
jgi:hypothetical protein